jgi:hypothetical protein
VSKKYIDLIPSPLGSNGQVPTVSNGKVIWSTPSGVGGGVTDHTLLTNIGTNTHSQIDTHIADADIHLDVSQQNKLSNISITQPVDLDDVEEKISQWLTLLSDTNEPTGFIREFPETMGILELCVGSVAGYTNKKVIRVDQNGMSTILDTATMYDGSVAIDRTFYIHPMIYTGTYDKRNEETGITSSEPDTRNTSINGGEYYSIYVEGIKFNITTTQSIQFPLESGLQFVYHTTGATLALAQTFSFDYFEDRPITCTVYGNAVDYQLVNFGDERHGIQMDGETHRYLHFTQGTQYVSGMAINGLTDGGNSYTSISSGTAYDEDIYMFFPEQTNAPFFYQLWDATESKNVWRVTNDGTSIAYLPPASDAVWNENVGGQYQLTEVTGNDRMIVFFCATNNKEFPYVKILGQSVYNNRGDARDAVDSAINDLALSGLPSPEFLPIGAVIVDSNGDLETLDDGSVYLDLRLNRVAGSSGSSGTTETKEYASFYLSGAGQTALTNTERTLTINATDVNSNGSVFSLDSNQITVNKTGNFEINANVYLNNSSTARTEYSMWIEKNGVEVVGSRFASYQRGYDSGMSSGVNLITSVTSGDVFQIQCQLTDGSTSSGYQDANGTRFNIKEM